jgi:eukaryotic-like serine/threonine-protein kinase
VVYVGSNDDDLYGFDASTGATLWSAATGNGIQSSPAVANGMVYVGSADDNVYAYGLP